MQTCLRIKPCPNMSGKNSSSCLTELPISVLLHGRDHKLEGVSAQLKGGKHRHFYKTQLKENNTSGPFK